MPRPFGAVPNIINSIASPINVQFFDQDYAQILTDFNDSAIGYVNYGADTGTANNYVVTLAQAPSAYAAGTTVAFTPANSNTGASVINVNTVGSASIVRPDGTALIGGELVIGVMAVLVYNGSNFVLHALPWLPLATNLGANLNTNQSVNCQNASNVLVNFTFNAAITLTLNNLALGVPLSIQIANTAGSTLTFKLVANQPGGTAYGSIATKNAGTATGFTTNWITGAGILSAEGLNIQLQSVGGTLQGFHA